MNIKYLKIGTKLNQRYIIREVIGSGGFGIIYSAFDTLINSMVAIKEFYIQECMGRSEDGRQVFFSENQNLQNQINQSKAMFLHEIEIMKQTQNVPYTPRMKESFSENGTEYIVMSYIRGTTLMDILKKKGTIKAGDLFRMLNTVMTALIEMHKLQIIHRDISPGNMILCEDGDLYLIDFGGATSVDMESPLWNPQIVEHIGFHAPEYNCLNQQGYWTDIYSLCAVIVYLLSGDPVQDPQNRSAYDALPQIITRLKLSGKQQSILRKGLQIDYNQRYHSIKQFYEELYGEIKKKYVPEKVRYCACTQIGDRKINQDNLMVDGIFYFEGRDFCKHGEITCQGEQLHLIAVCDGVGGSQSGELASRAVVQALDHFVDYFRDSDELPERLIEEQLNQINEKIITLGKKIGTTATTVSLLLWKKNQYYIANIGDSPIYLKRKFRLYPMHTPHTKARAKQLEGKQFSYQDKHTLMNYLGKEGVAGSQIASFRHGYLQKGDTFLICSDGITNKIDLDRLKRYLGKKETRAVEIIYRVLKTKANKDNCTAVVIKF